MAMNDGVVVVTVEPGEVQERSGSFTNDAGEAVEYTTRKQPGRLENNGYVYPYAIRLEKGQPAFAPGRYLMRLDKMLKVNNEAHSVGKFPILEPLKA